MSTLIRFPALPAGNSTLQRQPAVRLRIIKFVDPFAIEQDRELADIRTEDEMRVGGRGRNGPVQTRHIARCAASAQQTGQDDRNQTFQVRCIRYHPNHAQLHLVRPHGRRARGGRVQRHRRGVTKGVGRFREDGGRDRLGLVGIMTLWLGMMRIAEAAGLVTMLGRALRPVLRWLFPEVPPDHPADGAIVVAIAANMLGLNNAATPLGIKAMEELQTLNPRQGHGLQPDGHVHGADHLRVQFIPATMIGVLAAAGSQQPDGDHLHVADRHAHRHGRRRDAAKLLQRFYPPTPQPRPVAEVRQ